MKKIIAWLLVLALTAAISIGATLAYLTDTDEDVNVMTLGNVKIDQLEYERVDDETKDEDAAVQEFHDNKPLMPGVYDTGFDFGTGDANVDWTQIGKDGYTSDIWDPAKINNEVDKMVFVKNKGDYDAYVRTVFAFEAGKYTTLDEFNQMVHLNLNDTDFNWDWIGDPVTIGDSTYFVATATYNNILEPGKLTEISLSQIALDKTATNEDVEAFGETYQILVKSQGIQADGFEDPAFALDEGFGTITTTNIPWENDDPTHGIDIRTALHYLNGDGSTLITKNISNITFGLNKDYVHITDNHTGTLIDSEQDVPVYAYYVKNGATYDLYFLASDDIYAPADCYQLMYDGATRSAMSSLVSFNAENLNTSRTTSMARMFRDVAVTSLDLSGFDTGAVTDMSYMFYNCNKMHTLNVTGWDTSEVKTTQCMFYFDNKLTSIIGEEDWALTSVETVQSMFRACTALETLDMTNWDMSKVKNFSGFFCSNSDNTGAMALKELNGMENWNVQCVETMRDMFYGCGKLETVDMSNWNVSNLVTVSHMFADCFNLQNVDFTGWNTTALTNINAMFNDCRSMKTVDLSNFDTSNIEVFAQAFESCRSLESIVGLENWNTGNGHDFSEMFSGCGSLKELNLSTFDTRNANPAYLTEGQYENCVFQRFLSGCNKLEKITFGPNFSFDGMGNCRDDYKMVMPAASGVEGWDGKWYNLETGIGYLPIEVPEETAATYVAVMTANP